MATDMRPRMGIWFHLAQAARFIFWLLLIGVLLLVLVGRRDTTQQTRNSLLDQFQSERKSRVIALIHRQESQSILGVQVSSYSASKRPLRFCLSFRAAQARHRISQSVIAVRWPKV